MKALRFYSAKDLRVDDVPRPECGADEVRLKVAYVGICGSDIHEYLIGPMLYGGTILDDVMAGILPADPTKAVNRYTGGKLPQIMGHEISATIVEVGKDVQGYKVGQRVAVNAAIDDRHHGLELCDPCEKGRHNICDRISFYGVNSPAGGFAEEMVVKSLALVPIPDGVSLKIAALAEPLAVAAHSIRMSGFQKGQNAIVFGAGPIGTALTFLLKDAGAKCVMVSEVASSRLEQAKTAGADRTVNPLEEKVLDVVHELMGTGADVAFEACGLQATFDAALASVKTGGTIFNVAILEKPLQLNTNILTRGEKKLLAGNAYTAEDFDRVMRVLSTRGPDVEKFISSVVSLDRAVADGFEEIVNNKSKHNKILVELNGEH